MQLHPTKIAVELTLTAVAVLALGIVGERPSVVAWAGALLLGLAIARAVTLLAVARVRSAGFEMLWHEPGRSARASVGQTLELKAHVRNRDDRAARYIGLRSVHSPHLQVELEPSFGEVPAGGRLLVTVKVTPRRVGRHGLYGLSLEVRGGPGLYEVPLTFSNPHGVEVLPEVYVTQARPARGGRSRSHAEAGIPGQYPRGHYELREIRDYVAGDPFKRLAWKASARRGRLMVREFEQEERDVVWLVLDASVELWAGESGGAPLDHAIGQLASLATRHVQQGHKVGLCIVAARRLAWLSPESGPAHCARLLAALSFDSGCIDADRSGLDEAEVGLRVLEHVRPLEPSAATLQTKDNLDRLNQAAQAALTRAPFRGVEPPRAASLREQQLRTYLAAFGLDSPARLEPDRTRTDATLASELTRILRHKPRPNQIVICSPLPDPDAQAALLTGLGALPRRGCRLCWLPIPLRAGLDGKGELLREPVRFAFELTDRTRNRVGSLALKRLGISVLSPPRRRGLRWQSPQAEDQARPAGASPSAA
jgi:uncharacterized protein (DUF58 family)